jgi:hypothetical protein
VISNEQLEDVLHACRIVLGEPSFELRDIVERRVIERGYRKRVLELHPDRAAVLGQDEAVLTARFQDLQRSYGLLKELLGQHEELIVPVSAPERPARPRAGRARSAGARRPGAARRRDFRWPSSPWPCPQKEDPKGRRPTSQAKSSQGNPRIYVPVEQDDASALLRFLYRQGYLSLDQLTAAQIWLFSHRPMVGRLAVDWGYLQRRQVATILRSRQTGERFCDAAVRVGMLSQFQRLAILGRQRKLQQPVDSFLLDRHILSADELRRLKITFAQ